MSNNTTQVAQKAFVRVGTCLLGVTAVMLPLTAPIGAQLPVVIRGIPSASAETELRLAYQASFPNGSLEPSVDQLGIGPLRPGDSQIADIRPTVTPETGEMELEVTRPAGLAPGVIAASGLFATPVKFDQGSRFELRATFVRPIGPRSGGWSAGGVTARTGGVGDLNGETRVAATLNVRPGGTARLNVPLGATSPTFIDLPPSLYEAIFRPVDPAPFTLRLLVDRETGSGTAMLKVEDSVLSRSFQLAQFQANKGPAITAVGATIANANAPAQTVSVRLRDFRIYLGKHHCSPSQPFC